MSYYAVLDTNVLISSLLTRNKDAATARVIYAIISGDIIPLYSKEIVEEYTEVLHRAKFPFSEESVQGVLEVIRQFGVSVDPSPTGEILVDPDDLVFYEVVMEKRDEDAYLVTGNIKHFPRKDFIVTPAEMMAIIDATE